VTSIAAARRFLRHAHHLDAPLPDIATALAYHGYVQIDPINVCGRMHDLILRNRVAGYREGDLMRFLHGDTDGRSVFWGRGAPNGRPSLPSQKRTAFEHHLPNTGVLVAFPLEAWPHLLRAMRQWSIGRGAWAGRLTPREKTLATQLLAEIATRGPLGSEDFEDDRTARRVWGASRLVKATLQKLFFHGRILIAQRENNRRRYDLPERVLPASVLARPETAAADTARWLALLKLRQRRLATFTREELRAVEDEVQAVAIENCPTLYCLVADVPLLERSTLNPATQDSTLNAEEPHTTRLLAPLDPIIYDRRITSALWGFDYTWEAYTPPRKRVRGYYALPVLVGTELVGHVDPKADRAARKLIVRARRIRRGHATAAALRDFANWLGLRRR
jgi:uncharacterized protein YcaQ